jgi:hypothetical protein
MLQLLCYLLKKRRFAYIKANFLPNFLFLFFFFQKSCFLFTGSSYFFSLMIISQVRAAKSGRGWPEEVHQHLEVKLQNIQQRCYSQLVKIRI